MSSKQSSRRRQRIDVRPPSGLLTDIFNKINITNCDILIIGDGSGSAWQHACGWAATVVCMRHHARRFFYGAMECGSINMAELMPYVQALTWYDAHYGENLLKTLGYLNVHIVTDSQVIARWGNRAMDPDAELPRPQKYLLAGLREFRRLGYHCKFHWAARNTSELNWAADIMAGLSRITVSNAVDSTYFTGPSPARRAADALASVVFRDPETGEPLSPYLLNPDTSTVPSTAVTT